MVSFALKISCSFFPGFCSLPQLRCAYSLLYEPTLLLETALDFSCASTCSCFKIVKISSILGKFSFHVLLSIKHQSYSFRFSSFVTIKTNAGLKICQNNQQNVANTFMTFLYSKTFKTTLKSQQIWYQIEAPFFGSYFKYTKRFLFHQNSSQASKNKCPGSTQFLPIRPWGLKSNSPRK